MRTVGSCNAKYYKNCGLLGFRGIFVIYCTWVLWIEENLWDNVLYFNHKTLNNAPYFNIKTNISLNKDTVTNKLTLSLCGLELKVCQKENGGST
jgi:hypothetical protein